MFNLLHQRGEGVLYGEKKEMIAFPPIKRKGWISFHSLFRKLPLLGFPECKKRMDPGLRLFPAVLCGRMLQNRDNAEIFYETKLEGFCELWKVERRGMRCDKNDGSHDISGRELGSSAKR